MDTAVMGVGVGAEAGVGVEGGGLAAAGEGGGLPVAGEGGGLDVAVAGGGLAIAGGGGGLAVGVGVGRAAVPVLDGAVLRPLGKKRPLPSAEPAITIEMTCASIT